jgi:hypothetical protein
MLIQTKAETHGIEPQSFQATPLVWEILSKNVHCIKVIKNG